MSEICPWCKHKINPDYYYLFEFQKKRKGKKYHKIGINGVSKCFECAKKKILETIKNMEVK